MGRGRRRSDERAGGGGGRCWRGGAGRGARGRRWAPAQAQLGRGASRSERARAPGPVTAGPQPNFLDRSRSLVLFQFPSSMTTTTTALLLSPSQSRCHRTHPINNSPFVPVHVRNNKNTAQPLRKRPEEARRPIPRRRCLAVAQPLSTVASPRGRRGQEHDSAGPSSAGESTGSRRQLSSGA